MKIPFLTHLHSSDFQIFLFLRIRVWKPYTYPFTHYNLWLRIFWFGCKSPRDLLPSQYRCCPKQQIFFSIHIIQSNSPLRILEHNLYISIISWLIMETNLIRVLMQGSWVEVRKFCSISNSTAYLFQSFDSENQAHDQRLKRYETTKI